MEGYGLKFLSISPKDISASKLGDLIKQYEIAVKSEYKEATGYTAEDCGIVALKSIEENCTTLRFTVAALLVSSAALVAQIPKPGQYIADSYTPASQKLYQKLFSFSSSFETEVESFRFSLENNAQIETISRLTPQDIAQFHSVKISSPKTLYGTVVAVGGIEPKVRIQLDNGDTLNCKSSVKLAQKAAGFLYERVKFSGKAKTSFSFGEAQITEFNIEKIDAFEVLSALDLIQKLKPHIKEQLNRIEDPDEYFFSMRENS